MTKVHKPKMQEYHHHVLVCVGSKCTANGEGQALYIELKEKLKKQGLDKGDLRVARSRSSCLGTCMSGPLLCVHPEGIWYYDIDSNKLDKIIDQHFIHGKPVTEYIYHAAKNKFSKELLNCSNS